MLARPGFISMYKILQNITRHFDLNKNNCKIIWTIKFLLRLTWLVFFIILFKVPIYIEKHSLSSSTISHSIKLAKNASITD